MNRLFCLLAAPEKYLALAFGLAAGWPASADVFEYSANGSVTEHAFAEYEAHRSGRESLNVAYTAYLPPVAEAAAKHGVPMDLILAVIQAESNFQPRVFSTDSDGEPLALGLMQLTPATARRFGIADETEIWHPAKNIDAGTRYLSWLIDRFDGDFEHAIAAYNAGEGNIETYGGVPPFPETEAFVARVERHYGKPLDKLAPPAPEDLVPINQIERATIDVETGSETGFLVFDATQQFDLSGGSLGQ